MCALDKDKVEEYLQNINDPHIKTLVTQILDQTCVCPTRSCEDIVVNNTIKFLERAIDFYVIKIDNSSTSHFAKVAYHLYSTSPNFKGFITHDKKGNYTLPNEPIFNAIIFDDACYSGVFMLGIMDEMTYNKPNLIKISVG